MSIPEESYGFFSVVTEPDVVNLTPENAVMPGNIGLKKSSSTSAFIILKASS